VERVAGSGEAVTLDRSNIEFLLFCPFSGATIFCFWLIFLFRAPAGAMFRPLAGAIWCDLVLGYWPAAEARHNPQIDSIGRLMSIRPFDQSPQTGAQRIVRRRVKAIRQS
jgi:hypothetical protein